MGKIISIFFGILMLIFAYFYIASGIDGLYSDREFEGNVGRTTGTILRVWTTSHGRGRTEYDAAYNYVTDRNGFQEATQRVSPDTYARVQVGTPIPVKFLLGHPAESRIDWSDEDEWQWIKDAGSLIQGILIIGGSLIACWLALPRSKSSWEDAAIKADLRGKNRWS